ncbi:MAG: carbohydrate kinase, partial [Psychrosphaera sp.]|nr:carbohydrate kinase [Psychrosphaera sp.]
MKTVICFGEALIDFLNTGHELVDSLALQDYRQYPGGAPANAAVAVAKLGGVANFAGQVGDDMFGAFLIEALQRYNVNTQYVLLHTSAKTALAFIKLDETGDRSFSFYRENTADLLFGEHQVDENWFNNKPLFHFCSNTLTTNEIAKCTEYAVSRAQHHGALISFDVNLRHNLWTDNQADINRVNALVHRAHLVKFSREEIEYLAAGNIDNYITDCLNLACQLLIVTDGEHEIEFHTKAGKGIIAPPTVTVVDTTAGGDAFIGGLLYGLSHFNQPLDVLKELKIIAR